MRDNYRINPQIIDKLSREPSPREVRIKFLEELAAKENIVLKLDEYSTSTKLASGLYLIRLREERRSRLLWMAQKRRWKIHLKVLKNRNLTKNKKVVVVVRLREDRRSRKERINRLMWLKKAVDPENKKSKQKQEGNDDGSAKRGKKKQIYDDELSDGDGDVMSKFTRTMSHPEETIKLDEDTVELLEKDVDIDWTEEETEHVENMVHSFENTTGFTVPFSVKTRRVRKQ